MTPVVPCSAGNISSVSGTIFTTSKNRCFARYCYSGQAAKRSSTSLRILTTLPKTTIVFPQLKYACASHNLSRIQRVSATVADVVVEEQDSRIADEASPRPSERVETNGEASAKSDISVARTRIKRRRGRKSEMPPVRNEELVSGAIFTGKVRSILPFGAFVDFGAFTDGLVHVSNLSDNFVKDVNNVVSLGQEVKVRLVEVDTETGRISLSMRDADGSNKPRQKKEAVASSDKPRSARRVGQKKAEVKKTSKFVKGQDLMGTVKNFARAGAFISLPDGEEGFLPTSEEADEGFGAIMGNSSLEVGQEVNIRVLRITRGTVTLTMKKEEDAKKFESQLKGSVVHTATNPFVIAFRRNKEIAAFLDEREKLKSLELEEVEETLKQHDSGSKDSQVQAELELCDASTESVSDVNVDIGEQDTAKSDVNSPVAKNEVLTQTSNAPLAEYGETVTQTSLVSRDSVSDIQLEDGSAKEEVLGEAPANKTQVETYTPEGNGRINSSSRGPDESSSQGSVSKGL